jgi:hypothetical protein
MSFVGPRPEVRKYVNLYSNEQLKVLNVTPGLTDFASLTYYNEYEILSKFDDPEKGYILTPDMDKVKAVAASVFGEMQSGPTAADLARQAIQSEAARVVVLNGTTAGGLGTEVATSLAADGFQVVAVGNADRADYGQSVLITYGDGKDATREALVSRFGMPPDRVRSESPSETTDFTLVVGEDLASAGAVQ